MVNVTVGGVRSQITIPVLVDTGFDGYICLPIALAVNLAVVNLKPILPLIHPPNCHLEGDLSEFIFSMKNKR